MREPEPARTSPGGALSRKMSRLRRRDTLPELTLRRELHRRGLRYRLQQKVPGNNRRTIDVALTRARVAVYVDGCFWHGCPEHRHEPKQNSTWWEWKLANNRQRDADTDAELLRAGWVVVRVWEHETAQAAADRVETVWRERTGRLPPYAAEPGAPPASSGEGRPGLGEAATGGRWSTSRTAPGRDQAGRSGT